jgi:hypothetical protein
MTTSVEVEKFEGVRCQQIVLPPADGKLTIDVHGMALVGHAPHP